LPPLQADSETPSRYDLSNVLKDVTLTNTNQLWIRIVFVTLFILNAKYEINK